MSTTGRASWGIAAVLTVTARPPFFPFPDEGTLGDGHFLALANRALWLLLILPLAFVFLRLLTPARSTRFQPTPPWVALWTALTGTALVEHFWPYRPASADLHFSAGIYLLILIGSFALFAILRYLAPIARQQFILSPSR